MEHMLVDAGLRMTYLRDPYQIDELDQDAILRDLSEGETEDLSAARLSHRNLSDFGHVILARDSRSAQTMALLAMRDGSTGQEDFLQLETAFVAPAARGRKIMNRMVALALLRVASFGPVPQVVVARTANPVWYRGLRKISRQFTGAVFFPDHESPAIRLDSAGLARRLAEQIAPNRRFDTATATLRGSRTATGKMRARPTCDDPHLEALFGRSLRFADQMLAVIDLRAQTEETILADARRVYRARQGARPQRAAIAP